MVCMRAGGLAAQAAGELEDFSSSRLFFLVTKRFDSSEEGEGGPGLGRFFIKRRVGIGAGSDGGQSAREAEEGAQAAVQSV